MSSLDTKNTPPEFGMNFTSGVFSSVFSTRVYITKAFSGKKKKKGELSRAYTVSFFFYYQAVDIGQNFEHDV